MELMQATMIAVSEAMIIEARCKPSPAAEVPSQLAKMSTLKVGEISHAFNFQPFIFSGYISFGVWHACLTALLHHVVPQQGHGNSAFQGHIH